MQKERIFISSVQTEFVEERAMLFDYIRTDALLGQIFEPFIFEKTEAKCESASNVYLEQVERCDIYIGLLGEKYGNEIVRPIPSLHIYEGDLFELIDQTVSFVMSRINAKVSGRHKGVLADIMHELPLLAVTEAIVNAVCHRDYTSNGSVQVTLYNNRLEIWNPGQLPYGLTPEILKSKHKSFPANPLIARPLYLYGAIEQVGTGTEMLVKYCLEQGLPSPDFECNNDFNVVFWRNEELASGQIEDAGGMTGGMTLSDIQVKIIEIILDNPKISYKKMANMLKINISAIQKHTEKLKQAGLLEREGADFGGYWKIKNK